MPTRREEVTVERRTAAGLPVLYCPNCGRPVQRNEGHWVADLMDETGRIVPGYYTCGKAKR